MSPEMLAQAACRDASPGLFFPSSPLGVGRGHTGDHLIRAWRDAAAPALELCAVCPVREPCLAAALADGDLDGVRGGLVPPELRALAGIGRRRRFRGLGVTRETAGHGSESKYTHGCRCDKCRDAHAAYNRERRAS